MIWRYMDIGGFVSLLARGLFFCRRQALGDPWEGCWSEVDVLAFREAHRGLSQTELAAAWKEHYDSKIRSLDQYGISCWHRSNQESAALWSVYAPLGLGIAIQSSVERVLDATSSNGRQVRHADVTYVDYSKEAIGNDPVTLLSHKRNHFEHEKELRFFVRFRDDELQALDDWHSLLEQYKRRHISTWPPRPLVLPAPFPPRNVTDSTLSLRAAPAGINLEIDVPKLIQKVYLAPRSTWTTRRSILASCEAFGVDKQVVAEPTIDRIPPDILDFVDVPQDTAIGKVGGES